jgi:T5SS/PEP-CTERM-associated repeat protein
MILGMGSGARAATNTWQANVNTNFANAGNWSVGTVPGATDTVIMDGSGVGPGGELIVMSSDVTVGAWTAGYSGDFIDVNGFNLDVLGALKIGLPDYLGNANAVFQSSTPSATITADSLQLGLSANGYGARLEFTNGISQVIIANNIDVGVTQDAQSLLEIHSGVNVSAAALRTSLNVVGTNRTSSVKIHSGATLTAAHLEFGISGPTANGILAINGTLHVTGNGTDEPFVRGQIFVGGGGTPALFQVDTNLVFQAGTMFVADTGTRMEVAGISLADVLGRSASIIAVDGTIHSSKPVIIGDYGAGEVTLAGGHMVTAGGILGNVAGSGGTVTVSGTGSAWTNQADLVLGRGGFGKLVVEAGGFTVHTSVVVGAHAAGSGQALITGSGSQWDVTGSLQVGALGVGSLAVSNAGLITAGQLIVGATNSAGDSSVTAKNGGVVAVGGATAGATDTVVVDGSGGLTVLRPFGTLELAGGKLATGNLLLDGGTLTAAKLVRTGGTFTYSRGTFFLSDDDLLIAGAGQVTSDVGLTNGDQLAVSGTITVGADRQVTLGGATLTSANLLVGGTLTVNANGRVALPTGLMNIATNGVARWTATGAVLEAGTLSVSGLAQFSGGASGQVHGVTSIAPTGTVELRNTSRLVADELQNYGRLIVTNTARATIGSVDNHGTIEWSAGTSWIVAGAMTNAGRIRLGSFNSAIQADGPVVLTGGGTLQLASFSHIRALSAGSSLHNVDNTIVGLGTIGRTSPGLTFINEGVVDANVAGEYLAINLFSTVSTNLGVLRASNGGTLELYGTFVGTAGSVTGSIWALNASIVELHDATLEGGLLATTGSGRFETADGATLDRVTIATGAVVRALSGASLNLYGNFINAGLIHMQGSYLWLAGPLVGGGELQLDPESFVQNSLINHDHRIHGAGTLEAAVVNHGTISATVAGEALHFHMDYGHTNHGLIEARSGGRVEFAGNTGGTGRLLADGGELSILPGVTVSTTGTVTIINAGHLRLDSSTLVAGSLTLDATSFLTVASTLQLAGDFRHDMAEESQWSWGEDGVLAMTGGVGADTNSLAGWARLEAAGTDLGDVPAGYTNNFQVAKLVIGAGARVVVGDELDSGNRNGPGGAAEALYVDTLEFADATGLLGLNGVTIYYNQLIGDPSQLTAIPEPGSGCLVLVGLLLLAKRATRIRRS